MSLILEILEDMWNANLRFKGGVRANMFGIPRTLTHSDHSFRNTLSRLHKNGLVKNNSGKWLVTKEGKKYLEQKKLELQQFKSPFKKHTPKNLLLMFDIPESRKMERKWLRKHLIKFNYFMLQKSVWIGPSPLPKEFRDYIKEIQLQPCIKTFKLANPYKIDNKEK